jgi:hypothetical protein
MRKKLGTRFPAVRSLPSDLLSCGRHPIWSTVPAAVRAAQIFVSRRRDPDAAAAVVGLAVGRQFGGWFWFRS